MAEFSGELGSVNLLDLIQEACLLPGSCTISLSSPQVKGIIVISDGRVVHAQSSTRRGEDALYELMTLKKGGFQVEFQAYTFQKTIHRDWEELLKECDIRVNGAEYKADFDEMGVEPSVRFNSKGEVSKLDEIFRALPGVTLAVEMDENLELIDHSGIGQAEPVIKMAEFLSGVGKELGKIMESGEMCKVSLYGDQVLYLQERGRKNGHVGAFFVSQSNFGSVYRAMGEAVERYVGEEEDEG